MRPSAVLILAALTLASAAAAHEVRRGDLTLSELHVRAPIAPLTQSAGYLVVANAGAADRLLGAACACSERVELHAAETDRRGVSRMRQVRALDVPAGGRLALTPAGSAHLMLIGVRGPLSEGQRIPLALRFERAGIVVADFHVASRLPASATPAAADPHAHH